ncbi:unnamed protein product [Dibothriocephalus latus]|uniref:Uncharacterized protein n=1 Tax=Dibothriocephalus latus TaxID=60516 RepID=A0A3P7L4W5_DIBLA|nr:unnamed protein product [Dibothriocephalus latus]
MMHHMADQYPPLPQGDQRPGGVLADAAIACYGTWIKDGGGQKAGSSALPLSSRAEAKSGKARAADPVIAEGPEEQEEEEEEEKILHFEPAPPAQTDCGETMCTAASLPGKTCASVCRSMKSQGSDRTGCKKPVGCSGVSLRRKGRKLTGLPKKPEPNSGKKQRLKGGSEALKAVPVSSGQSSSLEEEVPVEVISPPNAIRTGTEKSSSRCAESCSLQRGPSKCLTRKRTTASSAAQSPKSELKTPSRTQQDDKSLEKIKEKGQRASGGAVLKTPTHVTNKMDESTLPQQKRALRENSQLESPLKAPFLGEIQADVNTVICGQPSPDKGPFGTEVNYAEMCRTGVLSGLPFSDKDLEEDYLSCLSQKGELINQTQAQLSKKVASAREQLASVLDLLERTDQQDYTEEEFLREVKKLNLDSDFPVTPSYYATKKKAAGNETEAGGGPSAVPRIRIASESSQGLPEAPAEKTNTEGEDGKPPCDSVSEEAASSVNVKLPGVAVLELMTGVRSVRLPLTENVPKDSLVAVSVDLAEPQASTLLCEGLGTAHHVDSPLTVSIDLAET